MFECDAPDSFSYVGEKSPFVWLSGFRVSAERDFTAFRILHFGVAVIEFQGGTEAGKDQISAAHTLGRKPLDPTSDSIRKLLEDLRPNRRSPLFRPEVCGSDARWSRETRPRTCAIGSLLQLLCARNQLRSIRL